MQVSLFRLRNLLGEHRIIEINDGSLRLNPQLCSVDAHLFEKFFALGNLALQEKLNKPEQKIMSIEAAMEHFRHAIALYHGELFPGLTVWWVLRYREQLRSKFIKMASAVLNNFICTRCKPHYPLGIVIMRSISIAGATP